ncbi:MAG: sigma-70 family RNA polymerase sigma factor [Acidobacteriota bacterium]
MPTMEAEITPHPAAAAVAAELDRDAFGRIVEQYKDRMVNYLTRLTGERERAEDVAQETFVRFYQHRDRYRDEGTLAAYLFRIATNLVRSEERRRSRWRLLVPMWSRGGTSPDGVHTVDSPPTPDPQRSTLASEEHLMVTRAIAALDLTLRAPLVLREIEGLSYRDIAEVLGLAEGTVKSRLHRARELLKEALAPYWRDGDGAPDDRDGDL